jgi:hypothetical protein
MGYNSHHKGHRYYHLEIEKFFMSQDVVFHESVFPFSIPTSSDMSHLASPTTPIEPSLVSTTTPISVSLQPRVRVSTRNHGSSLSTIPMADHNVKIDPPSSPLSDKIAGQSNSLASSSASTTGSLACEDQYLKTAHPWTHHMATQAQNNIIKPCQFHDGIIRYPIPQVLLSIQDGALTEATCFFKATITIP